LISKGIPLEPWVLGIIMVLVGMLVVGCSFGNVELGFPFLVAGITSSGAGSLIFFTSFRKWIKNLQT